jgi:hypothetical protein
MYFPIQINKTNDSREFLDSKNDGSSIAVCFVVNSL